MHKITLTISLDMTEVEVELPEFCARSPEPDRGIDWRSPVASSFTSSMTGISAGCHKIHRQLTQSGNMFQDKVFEAKIKAVHL